MFKPAQDAQLTTNDIRLLFGICRQTAAGWLSGRHQPHFLRGDTVKQTLAIVTIALEAGDLPLNRSIPRRERLMHLHAILKKHAPRAAA